MLYSEVRDRLFQFAWRPRLPSLLPPEKEADLSKNLKQYTKKWVPVQLLRHSGAARRFCMSQDHLAHCAQIYRLAQMYRLYRCTAGMTRRTSSC
jgi:hypothetical protein